MWQPDLTADEVSIRQAAHSVCFFSQAGVMHEIEGWITTLHAGGKVATQCLLIEARAARVEAERHNHYRWGEKLFTVLMRELFLNGSFTIEQSRQYARFLMSEKTK